MANQADITLSNGVVITHRTLANDVPEAFDAADPQRCMTDKEWYEYWDILSTNRANEIKAANEYKQRRKDEVRKAFNLLCPR